MFTEKILNEMTDHDLAVLADWAGKRAHTVPQKDWKRAYALMREGADLLLRRRARSKDNGDMSDYEPPTTTNSKGEVSC
jgi:hypothetical protein